MVWRMLSSETGFAGPSCRKAFFCAGQALSVFGGVQAPWSSTRMRWPVALRRVPLNPPGSTPEFENRRETAEDHSLAVKGHVHHGLHAFVFVHLLFTGVGGGLVGPDDSREDDGFVVPGLHCALEVRDLAVRHVCPHASMISTAPQSLNSSAALAAWAR